MSKYQWESQELKKRASFYDKLMFVVAIIAAAIAWFSKAAGIWGFILLVALAVVGYCYYVSWKAKSQDMKLKVLDKTEKPTI